MSWWGKIIRALSRAHFYLEKAYFWKDQGHGNLSCSASILYHLWSWTGERWRGILSNSDTSADSTTMESRFLLPSVDTWYQERELLLYASPLISLLLPQITCWLAPQSPRGSKGTSSCLSLTAVSNLRPWTARVVRPRLREWEKTTYSG